MKVVRLSARSTGCVYPQELFLVLISVRGHSVAQRLRQCATNRKVAGLIPDGVIGIFHRHNPSGRTMALGSTQPLTETGRIMAIITFSDTVGNRTRVLPDFTAVPRQTAPPHTRYQVHGNRNMGIMLRSTVRRYNYRWRLSICPFATFDIYWVTIEWESDVLAFL
jgi:hypothetical protein